VLEGPDEERAALIGHLQAGEDWQRAMAELLTQLGDEVGEIGRLRLVEALRRELSHRPWDVFRVRGGRRPARSP
jgi:hypothetical protein